MKVRNFAIYICVFAIVLASFKLPELLLNLKDNNIEIAVFNKEKTSSINVEADSIYLVRAIHDIESSKSIEISSPNVQYVIVEKDAMPDKGIVKNINEQIQKLHEYNILKNVNITKYKVGLINKSYHNDEDFYTVNHLILEMDDTQLIFNVEHKTGKILFIAFDKSNSFSEDKTQLLESFVKYLGLFVIDDWELFFDDVSYKMKSVKAGISVSLTEGDEKYMLAVHTF